MNCKTFVELVTAYLEDQLSAEDRADFEEHLRLCPGCDTYLDQFRTTISLLGQLPEESISSGARERLLDAFAGWRDRGPDGPA
jgi:anti-sigma factor RsiW